MNEGAGKGGPTVMGWSRVGSDPWFLAALLAGPAGWGVVAVWLDATPDVSRVVSAPGLFLLVVLVYPLLEELVFRGLLQGWLRRHWARAGPVGGLTWANVCSALAFALTHLIYQPWRWAMLVFFPGLIFGFFRDRYDSVWPGVVLHSYYNLGIFLLVPRLV